MPREEEMIFTHKKTQLIDEHDEHVHNDNVLDHGNSLAASDEKITPPNGLMGKPRYLSGWLKMVFIMALSKHTLW